MDIYEEKPKRVQAIQLNWKNYKLISSKLRRFLNPNSVIITSDYEDPCGEGWPYIRICTDDLTIITHGNFIIFDEYENFSVKTKEEFNKMYKLIEEE